jgi:hypothetical protein
MNRKTNKPINNLLENYFVLNIKNITLKILLKFKGTLIFNYLH